MPSESSTGLTASNSGPVPKKNGKAAANALDAAKTRFQLTLVLLGLVAGIILVGLGIGIGEVADLWSSGYGTILAIGAVFLAIAVVARYVFLDTFLPEVSLFLALFVAIELIAGAMITYVGIMNVLFENAGEDLILLAFTLFGLFLIADSLIFYRKAFRRLA